MNIEQENCSWKCNECSYICDEIVLVKGKYNSQIQLDETTLFNDKVNLLKNLDENLDDYISKNKNNFLSQLCENKDEPEINLSKNNIIRQLSENKDEPEINLSKNNIIRQLSENKDEDEINLSKNNIIRQLSENRYEDEINLSKNNMIRQLSENYDVNSLLDYKDKECINNNISVNDRKEILNEIVNINIIHDKKDLKVIETGSVKKLKSMWQDKINYFEKTI